MLSAKQKAKRRSQKSWVMKKAMEARSGARDQWGAGFELWEERRRQWRLRDERSEAWERGFWGEKGWLGPKGGAEPDFASAALMLVWTTLPDVLKEEDMKDQAVFALARPFGESPGLVLREKVKEILARAEAQFTKSSGWGPKDARELIGDGARVVHLDGWGAPQTSAPKEPGDPEVLWLMPGYGMDFKGSMRRKEEDKNYARKVKVIQKGKLWRLRAPQETHPARAHLERETEHQGIDNWGRTIKALAEVLIEEGFSMMPLRGWLCGRGRMKIEELAREFANAKAPEIDQWILERGFAGQKFPKGEAARI